MGQEREAARSARAVSTATGSSGLPSPAADGSHALRMRLWSLHPSVLDRAGLIACWREGLLARKVLLGETRGYRRHPQLERFRAHPRPVEAVDAYLHELQREATRRGYRFDRDKLGPDQPVEPIPLSSGQLGFELEHLRRKVALRNAAWLPVLCAQPHPLFALREGGVEPWERSAAGITPR
jgi:hypothetical protein